MPDRSSYGDYEPYGYIRRVPIYNTTIIIALLVVGVFAVSFGTAAHAQVFNFAYDPSSFWHRFHVWTLFTYPFVNRPSFFFLFLLFFFYWFGIDVERYLGKIRYVELLGLLFLVPTLVSTGWWLAGREGDFYLGGGDDLVIGVFVAYATFYPNVEYWGWITMKWLAFAGIVLSSLSYLSSNDWPGLTGMLACCGTGFGYVRWRQLGSPFDVVGPLKKIFRRKPKFRVVPRSNSEPPGMPVEMPVLRDEDQEVDSINPLLDKIARSGLDSLTPEEKAKLEKASQSLRKKNS